MAMIQAKMKAYADLPPVDDDVDLSFAATTFSDDDSGDGFDGADVKQLSPDEEGKRSPPPSSSFQSLRSKPQPVAGSAVPKHVAAGRYRSGSQNSPSSVRVLPPPHRPHRLFKKRTVSKFPRVDNAFVRLLFSVLPASRSAKIGGCSSLGCVREAVFARPHDTLRDLWTRRVQQATIRDQCEIFDSRHTFKNKTRPPRDRPANTLVCVRVDGGAVSCPWKPTMVCSGLGGVVHAQQSR